MNFPIAEMRRFENFEIGIIEIVTSILPVSDYYVQRIIGVVLLIMFEIDNLEGNVILKRSLFTP